LSLDKPDIKNINEIFDELGPIPRLCLDHDIEELSKYKASLSKELSDLTIKKLEDLVGAARNMEMSASGASDTISHKICLVRRLNPSSLNFSFQTEVLPVTPTVGSRIAFHLRNAKRTEQIRLYKQLTSLPEAKKLSGNLFEAYCQQLFSERILIKFVPMVRLKDSVASKNKPRYLHQWHTSNTTLAPPSLEKARKAALKEGVSIDIRPSRSAVISPKPTSKMKIKPDVYYTPAAPNQAGFDSFIKYGQILYIFQFTNATTLGVKDFLPFFHDCVGHPAQKNWQFIFVIPSDTETAMKCPVPDSDTLRMLTLYSAEVAVTI
jgi:hypothetical protein